MQLNLNPNIDNGWERKYIKHNKTFSDNTLEKQKNELFPNKVAMSGT